MRLIMCLAIAAFPAVLAIMGCTEADFNAPGTDGDYETRRPVTDPDEEDPADLDTTPGGSATQPGPTTPPATPGQPPATDPEAGAPSETRTPPPGSGTTQPVQPEQTTPPSNQP